MEKGLVHLYCGNGKGKTTAAMGLCLRAVGQGMRVGIAQFLKSGSSGELKILKIFDQLRIFPFLNPIKFTFAMSEEDRRGAKLFYSDLLKQIVSECGQLDLLVLDEAVDAVNEKLLDIDELTDFLKTRPCGLEVVLTGRNPAQQLTDLADYISEIQKVKHPYEKGTDARKGIEW